jgi:putative ABC transport system permease protein
VTAVLSPERLNDSWHEVFETMRRHKLRTFLTGLSVAWGIFMLVLLLGAGNGLRTGTTEKFADDAQNSIWIFSGKTSMPYRGQKPGRDIKLTMRDYHALTSQVQGIDHSTARFRLRGVYSVSYGAKVSSFDVMGAHPDNIIIEKTDVIAGRYINHDDISERRKVAVIGDEVAEQLFGSEQPIGKYIQIKRIPFLVVGVFADKGGFGERRRIWIPVTSAQAISVSDDRVNMLAVTVGNATVEESRKIEEKTRELLAARHAFDPDDSRALNVRNNLDSFQKVMQMFDWIAFFIWIIGAGTILAGIVGVSNIMLISVRERTVEFGVRKAIGAAPASIISMVLAEALVLTAVAGYIGLVFGVVVLELIAKVLPKNDVFSNPAVDFRIAVSATILLVVAGSLAGFFPARKAARINPVAALRNE